MRLLDRYVIRNFLQAYIYCIAGFISIWLIFDISDNISTLLDERVGLILAVQYYLTQVPQVFIILLPVSLLLALLFSLGRMSRANEIVSRSEEHTSELQSHSFISYAVFCLKKKN